MSLTSPVRKPSAQPVSSPIHHPPPRSKADSNRASTTIAPATTAPPAVASWKRGLDISLILLFLPLILPLMLTVALWIKLISRGPAIYRQVRIGRNGRPFTLYKFRSMRVNADSRKHLRHFGNLVQSNRPMVKLDLLCDSRLIPGGCLLRAAGIDELPQLFNILRGEMSLVGPRPCLPEEYQYFTHIQRVRFQALPGLTGVWQSQGKNLSTFNEMNAMDANYVRNASPLLDLMIICRTPSAVISQMRLAYGRHYAATAKAASMRPQGGDRRITAMSTSQHLG